MRDPTTCCSASNVQRNDVIIAHIEDGDWVGDNYPTICFILKDHSAKHSFLYTTSMKLESMGLEEGELPIIAATLGSFDEPISSPWSSPFKPKERSHLFA